MGRTLRGHGGAVRVSVLAIATAAFLVGGLLTPAVAAPSDAARAELRGMIENVTSANARRYGATDSAGHSMDTAKVIQDSSGGYLAVYHTMLGDNRFHAFVATSTDLMNWTFAHDLGTGASQPTITQISTGGYVMAWEQDPNNHIAVRYYPDRAHLLSGSATKSYDAPRTLSSCAEGTPNIYSVTLTPDIDHSVIDIGGHYYANCDVDRQQRATLTNFSSWSTSAQSNFDNALLYWGVKGNIGDRDALTFRGYQLGLIEGQYTKNDFRSWRTFVYDYATGNADQTTIHTNGGSTAYANPSITTLKAPNGRTAVLVSLFLPSEGAAAGEAGQLLYYREYS
ncbi:hypothetical protein ACIPC1_13170 [Streptomyces sp. NPDC087263]|uniref:hypothetical protein n=1 Tax=Streptomyces sp. NPDC087263 TaxID=3365773 RepID=UPI00380F29DC